MKKSNLEIPNLKVILYGVPGSGKTSLVGSAQLDERTSPLLMLNVGGNPAVLRHQKENLPDVLDIEILSDFTLVYDWLAKGQPDKHPFRWAEFGLKRGYKSVAIDTLTDVQRMSFNKIVGVDPDPGVIPKSTEIQHFNAVLGHMVNFTRLFMGLPMHTFITMQERTDKDEQTGAMMQAPFIWGQSMVEVCAYAYCVGRLVHRARMKSADLKVIEDAAQLGKDEKLSVVMFTQPSGKYIAKDQYECLGPFMADPTVTQMLDRIYGPTKNGIKGA